jgi:hypothetical protein
MITSAAAQSGALAGTNPVEAPQSPKRPIAIGLSKKKE